MAQPDGPNKLTVQIYSSGSTPITDPGDELSIIEGVRYSTAYPGGLFVDASFFVPRDVTDPLPFKHAQRVVIRNSHTVCWEGFISDITYDFGARQGVHVGCLGYVAILNNRYKYNRVIDRRFSSHIVGVWDQGDEAANDKCNFDRVDRLRFEPKLGDQWITNDYAILRWNANGGSNAKRVKFDYSFSETGEFSPDGVKDNGLTDQTNAFDGSASTSVTVTLTTGQFWYVGSREPWNQARFDFGATVNANVSTLALEYHNGVAWTAVSGLSDGTSTGGKTWAQDGTISFTRPADWDPDTLIGTSRMYWVRMSVSANLTASIVINEIYTGDAQAWKFQLYDITNATELWGITASGSGSQDITLVTTSDQIGFRILSQATQRPTGSGIYGEITNLRVLCENAAGAVTTTVAEILQAYVAYAGSSAFSTSTALIAANTYDLETAGLTSDDLSESILAFMTRVAKFSSSDAAYSVGVRESEAVSGETKPVIYYEAVPALTDYDYIIRITDENLGGGRLVASAAPDVLQTWILVVFKDNRGRENWDYSNRDTTQGTKYIERTKPVRAGSGVTTLAAAAKYGATILNQTKNLRYYVDGPIPIKGYLLSKTGEEIPVSRVRAGERLKITNFLADFGDVSAGSGFTFLIQHAEYDDASETVTLTLGKPMELSALVSELAEREWAGLKG